MAESNSKLSAPLQKFAADLKTMLTKTETSIREMRAREASTKGRKLEKHELCPLCGGPDVNGKCACLDALKKNAESGADVEGGEGTQPMGMSEKALCKSCGKSHVLGKCDMDDVTRGKDLTKTAPPGEEKLVHKLKDEYGHDEAGKKKAFATAWAVKNGTVNKGEGAETSMVGGAMGKAAMPSSSAAALAPKAPAPATSIGQVNHEMGGFHSLAGGSPAPHAAATLAPSTKMNVGTAGRRAGNVQAPVSGTIPNAKAEKNFGSARSPLGTGAPGHATQTNMPSQLKAGMAPVSKKELPVVQSVPTKAVAGAKAPKAGKDVTVAKQGSGGEIKKGAKLSKAMPAPAPGKAPAGKGVGGKQPVGQGGGDAHKVAGGAPKAAPKPGLDKLKAAGTAEVGRAKGAANVQKLRGDLAAVAAKKTAAPHPITQQGLADVTIAHANHKNAQPSPESVDVDVSDFNQEGAPAAAAAQAARAGHDQRTAGQRMAAPVAAAPNAAAAAGAAARGGADPRTAGQRMAGQPAAGSPQGAPDALNGVRDQMNAPQKGGVNFLRGLFSMFHKKPVDPTLNPAPKWQQQGQQTSARFNGALPLRRAELSLSEMEEDHKEFVKKGLKVKKGEMAPPTEGLSSINHNRRMLSVKPGSPRRSKSKR